MEERGAWVPGSGYDGNGYVKELLLLVAAYRATHGGQSPPPDSLLGAEQTRLRRMRRGRFSLLGRLRRGEDEKAWPRGRPLRPFLVERSFLTDDFTETAVEMRLEAWPMITAYRCEGRVFTGEWFTYTMEVKAENRRQAQFLVDCIFSVELPLLGGGEAA